MVSSGRFCAGNGRTVLKIPGVGAGWISGLQKPGIRRRWAGFACSPRLRCKSGLCYTADANSPFEAHIYVR